mmetsp:Transcript_16723/g.38310  ORF Transcript_16723/g.38310 Transcript_16723/m.38310 type:complete len:225 (-) Transcript_16723:198-872(-)
MLDERDSGGQSKWSPSARRYATMATPVKEAPCLGPASVPAAPPRQQTSLPSVFNAAWQPPNPCLLLCLLLCCRAKTSASDWLVHGKWRRTLPMRRVGKRTQRDPYATQPSGGQCSFHISRHCDHFISATSVTISNQPLGATLRGDDGPPASTLRDWRRLKDACMARSNPMRSYRCRTNCPLTKSRAANGRIACHCSLVNRVAAGCSPSSSRVKVRCSTVNSRRG